MAERSKTTADHKYKPADAYGWTDGSQTVLEPFATDEPSSVGDAEHDQKRVNVVIVHRASYVRLMRELRELRALGRTKKEKK